MLDDNFTDPLNSLQDNLVHPDAFKDLNIVSDLHSPAKHELAMVRGPFVVGSSN